LQRLRLEKTDLTMHRASVEHDAVSSGVVCLREVLRIDNALAAAPIGGQLSHMASLGAIAQLSECSLTRTLLAYWHKLLVA
jgi:hypothetical protein